MRTIVLLSLGVLLLSGCNSASVTSSRVTLYDQAGKKTQQIDVSMVQEWDAATQKVGTDTKLVNAAERVMNRTADNMPEYLADFANRIQKQQPIRP